MYRRQADLIRQAYGEAGVERLIHIMETEIILGMRLLGATKISELVPEMARLSMLISCACLICRFQVERVDWQPLLPKL